MDGGAVDDCDAPASLAESIAPRRLEELPHATAVDMPRSSSATTDRLEHALAALARNLSIAGRET